MSISTASNQKELAYLVAQGMLDGFNRHYRIFREACRQARTLFESADWMAIQKLSRERIAYYDQRVTETEAYLRRRYDVAHLDEAVWQQVKQEFIGLLINHRQPELAESFFNSVSCRMLHRSYYYNDFIFVRPAVSTEHIDSDPPSYQSFYPAQHGLRQTLAQIFSGLRLRRPFADFRRDIRYLLRAVRQQLPRRFVPAPNFQIQVLTSLFFRNKGAYLLGKIVNGNSEYPFAVPILHDREDRLYLDTILLERDKLWILLSVSRAYFMVDMEVPSAYVQFIASMLPEKPRAEIYTMLGLQKHGKTMFYRDFLHHLKHSGDHFVIAPGIKGLVMLVFTLPSYPYVFKVIKDFIAPQKNMDRDMVKAKYLLVKTHDRVGRMADTLEYQYVAFPRARFSESLMEELRALAPSMVEEEGDTVIIKHLYIERRMVPLNIYLDSADAAQTRHALDEYATAIKQMAAANIFPGDMLLKNFGVSKYDRVLFYDYDEIQYMTECAFRRIPAPRSIDDEMSAEPWYTVGPNDVFPEEFAHFMVSDAPMREYLVERHGDLMRAEFWNDAKQRIEDGQLPDVYPYPETLRFANRFARRPGAPAPGGQQESGR
ncbi:MAG: bifunctional isocitrate dehydrogenase kinase/phosphatase [Burkholderiales bacterium]